MSVISQALLPEFDNEVATTRRVLERMPEDQPNFKPHQKSMSLARLAGHLAEIPGWAVSALGQDELDMQPTGQAPMEAFVMSSRAEALAKFDELTRQARELMTKTSDEAWNQLWTLKKAGQTLMTRPRIAVVRGFVMNHMIHHRAQAAVYLRMNDVPVPSIYGPSADEGQV